MDYLLACEGSILQVCWVLERVGVMEGEGLCCFSLGLLGRAWEWLADGWESCGVLLEGSCFFCCW